MSDLSRLRGQKCTYADFLGEPIKEKTIFFLVSGEDEEESILTQLYDSIEDHPCRQGYSIYWSAARPEEGIKEWCGQKDIALIPWEKERFLQLLATSAYLLSDVDLPAYFFRRHGQVYWSLSAIRDKEGRGRGDRPGYERESLSWRYSCDLLQSSHIRVTSEEDIRLLKEEYRLENIYDGLICKADGISQLRDLIFQDATQAGKEESLRLPVKKHRVLIQIDWKKRDHLREWLPLWLEYVDQDLYDVTVVTGWPEVDVDRYRLTELSEHARIMIRRGGLLSGSEQKTEVKEYADGFWLMPEEERESGHPDMQRIYEREWRKIFGCACFDTVVLTSMHPLWYLGAKKSCADVIFIGTREIRGAVGASDDGRLKWENKWGAIKKMKAAYWFGSEGLPPGSVPEGLRILPTPIPRKWLEGNTGELAAFWYQDKEYALVFRARDWRELRGQVEFIPLPPADRKAYVASGAVSGILPVFKQLHGQDPDALLYVFNGDPAYPVEEIEKELKGCVVPISGVICGNIPGAFDYFQRFQGGLIQNGEESGALASLMGILGKPVYRSNGGYVEEISIQVDKDSLYMREKEAVERIWGE